MSTVSNFPATVSAHEPSAPKKSPEPDADAISFFCAAMVPPPPILPQTVDAPTASSLDSASKKPLAEKQEESAKTSAPPDPSIEPANEARAKILPSPPLADAPAKPAPAPAGTTAAKQFPAMKELAEIAVAEAVSPNESFTTRRAITVLTPRPAHEANAEDSSATFVAPKNSEPAKLDLPVRETAAPANSQAEEISSIIRRVNEVVEKVRSDGRTSVEVQIKLKDGEQVTVKLQMLDGAVRTTFQTNSSELRAALTQAWSDFTSDRSERVWRETAPTFEPATPAKARPKSRRLTSGSAPGKAAAQSFIAWA